MIDIAGDKMIFEKQFWKELFSEFSNDDVTGLAAQLSYFFLLSLFPLLIFLLSLVSFLPVTQEDIFNMLQEYLPPNTQDLIQNNVQQVIDGRRRRFIIFQYYRYDLVRIRRCQCVIAVV